MTETSTDVTPPASPGRVTEPMVIPGSATNLCNEAEAAAFKASCTKSPIKAKGVWANYQRAKTGPAEYRIYVRSNTFMRGVEAAAGEFINWYWPENNLFPDGLAHISPPRAKAPHNRPCTMLDAKYSGKTAGQARYIDPFTFVSTRHQKAWLRQAYNKELGAVARLQRMIIRRGGKALEDKVEQANFAAYAATYWARISTRCSTQMSAYSAYCTNPQIPYHRYLIICGGGRWCLGYMLAKIVGPGNAVYSDFSDSHNWIC